MLEIWNLVFMQFDQGPDGARVPLPAPSVDTGAGLERIAAVMQGVPSNFDTDLFVSLLTRTAAVVGRPYDRGPAGVSFRVLADHARAVVFLLADGVFPANDGRGYVLRRILRRAVRHAWLLGRREPTLVDLARTVTETMGDVYPELRNKRDHIETVTRAEEERFFETIEGGLRRLDELRGAKTISGADAFKLYDTYGFPIDLTQLIAAERDQAVDLAGFERALAAQRERSRAAHASDTFTVTDSATAIMKGPGILRVGRDGAWVEVKPKARQKWVGYEQTRAETDLLAFRKTEDVVELVLEENPFYAESGGQVSDTGVVEGQGWRLAVEAVEKVNGRSAVVGRVGDRFEPTPVVALVDEPRRANIERNHTGTHLVHAALRKMLGAHVRQQGSVVAPDRLRFDFAHHGPIDDATLARIEEEVNAHIWENLPIVTQEMPYQQAIAAGAMAFFADKYGDVVRVVEVPGVSLELCGGTHVTTTGQIALFRFTHETGAAAGVRRIEALTGPAAYGYVRTLEQRLAQASGLLRVQPEHLARRIEAMLEEHRKLERRIEALLGESGAAAQQGQPIPLTDNVTLFKARTELDDRKQIGLMMDAFRANHQSAVSVVFSGSAGPRPAVHVAVTDDLVSRGLVANAIASSLSSLAGGKGGGRPHLASGSIADASKLEWVESQTPQVIMNLMKSRG